MKSSNETLYWFTWNYFMETKIGSSCKDLTLYERNSDKLSSWDIPQKLKSVLKGTIHQFWIPI